MNLGNYISNIIEQQGMRKNWVADKADMNYKTFIDKLNRDTFTAKEFIKLSIVLNFSVDQLKEEMLKLERKPWMQTHFEWMTEQPIELVWETGSENGYPVLRWDDGNGLQVIGYYAESDDQFYDDNGMIDIDDLRHDGIDIETGKGLTPIK